MKHFDKLTLTEEQKKLLTAEIKAFFLTEREEVIGDLAAGLILDFIAERIGTEFYNQGVSDSYKYMLESTEDLLSIQK